MIQVCSYYRVSTDEQAQLGQSIETQKKLCSKWASDNGYHIAAEYTDEGKSATSLNRPALKELLVRCQEDKHIKAVIVQDTDRLARNTLDHLTIKSILQKAGVELISVSQPMIDNSPEGNLIDTIIASVNAFQSQITGRKTSKVMEQKAMAGYWPGMAPPGYKNIDNPSPAGSSDKRIVTLDTTTAELVKRMFDLYSTGNFSTKTLRDSIHLSGLRGKFGGKLQVSIVVHILKNPFYYGVVPWRGKIYPGKHEPLIDKQTFDLCQEIMTAHNQNSSRKRKHDMLLRGFLYCGKCGNRYWGGPHKKGKYHYYFCKSCRSGTYNLARDLEKQVEIQFHKLKITPDYAQEVIEVAKIIVAEYRRLTESDRFSLLNQKSRLEAKMREAEDNLLDKTLSKDSFRNIYSRLEQEMAEINSQFSALDTDYSTAIRSVEKIMDLALDLGNTYQNADPDLKRQYVGLFFDKLFVEDGKITKCLPSDQLKPFLGSKVQVRPNWLPR